MHNILENQTLEMKNVLSYRAKMTQQEMIIAMNQIGQFVKNSGALKDGYIATATYSVEVISGQQVMDVEILVPLDKQIPVVEPYTFHSLFKLTNALYIRHEGNPVLVQNSINQLNDFIISNNLQVATATYNVTVKEPTSQSEIDKMVIDIYVGINPNIL